MSLQKIFTGLENKLADEGNGIYAVDIAREMVVIHDKMTQTPENKLEEIYKLVKKKAEDESDADKFIKLISHLIEISELIENKKC